MTGENFDVHALKNGGGLTETPAAPADSGGAAGEKPAGEKPAGEKPSEVKPEGEKPAGEKPAGEKPAEVKEGEKPAGEKPAGEAPAGEKPAGEKPAGEKPAGAAPAAETDPVKITEAAKKEAMEALLKETGATSLEELKAKLAPKKELTPEEKTAAEQKYLADLDNFAVTGKFMSRDEVVALNNMVKSSDEELAFNVYSAEYKAAKTDATDEEIKQNFKLLYHTESTDEIIKKAGEKAMKKDADAVRGVLQSKMNSAKQTFDDTAMRKGKIPGYKSVIQSSIKENLPPKIELLVEGDEKVTFDITPEDHAEFEKLLVGEETFDAYLEHGSSQQVKDLLKDKIQGLVLLKNKDKIFKTIYEAGLSAGRKAGSSTGATNSFALNGAGADGKLPVVTEGNDLTAADTEKLGNLFGGPRF